MSALQGQMSSTQAAVQRLESEVASLNSTVQLLENGSLTAPSGPGLVQEAQSTCSYVCGPMMTAVQFSAPVRGGDMLVVTVVADDTAPLPLSDSLGTNLTLASRPITAVCNSNSGACQVEIYTGIIPSSGVDTVTVHEIDLGTALRVQAWEFSGVSNVTSVASCDPSCAPVSYQAGSILLATARGVQGSGPGFAWYQCQASSLAGSEYQVAASAGSTNFAFSTVPGDLEAAVVLS